MMRVKKALRDGFESDINQLNRDLNKITYHRGVGRYILNTDGLTIAGIEFYHESRQFCWGGKLLLFSPYFQGRHSR